MKLLLGVRPPTIASFFCIFFLCCFYLIPVFVFANKANMQRSLHHVRARAYSKILSEVPLRQPEHGQYRPKHVVHYTVIKYTYVTQLCLTTYHFPSFTHTMGMTQFLDCNHSFLFLMPVFCISEDFFRCCRVSVTGRKGYKLKQRDLKLHHIIQLYNSLFFRAIFSYSVILHYTSPHSACSLYTQEDF